tara:strand:+ start:57 stop:377 length:321 start_codon:yes stop_codon:yes gene_type:complete
MIRSIVTFITILTFVIPVNINAQDSEDIVFEFLFEAWDSLEISQQTIVRAERIVRQERQINDSLRTEIEVLKQSKFNLNYVGDVFVFILLGVAVLGLFYYISRMKL